MREIFRRPLEPGRSESPLKFGRYDSPRMRQRPDFRSLSESPYPDQGVCVRCVWEGSGWVGWSVCACVSVCVLSSVCTYVHTYIYAYIHTYTRIYIHTRAYTHACMDAQMHMSLHECMDHTLTASPYFRIAGSGAGLVARLFGSALRRTSDCLAHHRQGRVRFRATGLGLTQVGW